MNWQGIVGVASEQGLGFWLAAGAVALGVTLLLAALTQALRRGLSQRRRPPVAARTGRAPAPAPVVAASADGDTYTAATIPSPASRQAAPMPAVPAPAPTPAPEPAPTRDEGADSLAILLRRLQSAGDRLEQIADDLTPEAAASGLKSAAEDVEYVFRASGA